MDAPASSPGGREPELDELAGGPPAAPAAPSSRAAARRALEVDLDHHAAVRGVGQVVHVGGERRYPHPPAVAVVLVVTAVTGAAAVPPREHPRLPSLPVPPHDRLRQLLKGLSAMRMSPVLV